MLNYNESMRLERAVHIMREQGGLACGLASSKVLPVLAALAYKLKDGWSYAELESELQTIFAESPSVRLESAEAQAKRAAQAREETPDPKAMTAQERLAHANAQKLADMEAKATESAKLASPEHKFERLQHMSPAQRLALANEMKRFGADEAEAPKPVTREELSRMSASRRLSVANEKALREADKDKSQ